MRGRHWSRHLWIVAHADDDTSSLDQLLAETASHGASREGRLSTWLLVPSCLVAVLASLVTLPWLLYRLFPWPWDTLVWFFGW